MSNRTDPVQTGLARGRGAFLTVFRLVAVLSAVFIVWSTIRLEPWSSPPERANAAEASIPWTEVNPIGVNTFLSREVEAWKRDRTLQMASDAGAGWIKEHFPWRDIETAQDSYWDSTFQQETWSKYDAIVASAEQNGLRIIARIDLAPQWARPAGSVHTAPPANYEDFADFIGEFVERYRGRVQFIQIWNEPNLAAEWGGEIDPAAYSRLLIAASNAAREADPNVVILSAPLAMTTENSSRAMDDLTYWQALYDAGAGPAFDIMSANAYGLDQPFDAPPDPGSLNIRRIELLREIAIANGDGNKPIWLNEYGWNASPVDFPPDQLTWSRVPERLQAEWTQGGIEYLRDEYHWFGVANTWYFRQVGDIGSDRSDYYFRAVDVEFTPRPLYRALADLGKSTQHGGPGVHNDMGSAVRPIGSWPIYRDETALHGQYISGSTGSSLMIYLQGNSIAAILRPDQQETTITVTTGGETHEIQIASGQSEVTLSTWSADQAVRKRLVEIEITGDAPLLLDGIDIREHRSSRTLILGTGLLALSLGGVFLLRRDNRR